MTHGGCSHGDKPHTELPDRHVHDSGRRTRRREGGRGHDHRLGDRRRLGEPRSTRASCATRARLLQGDRFRSGGHAGAVGGQGRARRFSCPQRRAGAGSCAMTRDRSEVRARVLRTAWIAFAVFAPVAIVANVAVEAYPHPRGIGFVPQLRYAVLTPICAVATLAAVLVYRRIAAGARPRRALALALGIAAVAVVALVATIGARGLLGPATVVVAATGLALWAIVPWFSRRRRRRLGTIATCVFG